MAEKNCTACGHEMGGHAWFCNMCGKKREGEPEPHKEGESAHEMLGNPVDLKQIHGLMAQAAKYREPGYKRFFCPQCGERLPDL